MAPRLVFLALTGLLLLAVPKEQVAEAQGQAASACLDPVDMPGDFNDDAIVDFYDLVNPYAYIYSLPTHPPQPVCVEQLNLNGDCGFGAGDFIYMLNYFRSQGTGEPVYPPSECACCD